MMIYFGFRREQCKVFKPKLSRDSTTAHSNWHVFNRNIGHYLYAAQRRKKQKKQNKHHKVLRIQLYKMYEERYVCPPKLC